MTVGGILLFLSYLASLYGPLESVLYAPSNVQFAAGSAKRVLEVLETEHEVREAPGALVLPRVNPALFLQRMFDTNRDSNQQLLPTREVGGLNTGLMIDQVTTSFKEGNVRETHNPLDLAIRDTVGSA